MIKKDIGGLGVFTGLGVSRDHHVAALHKNFHIPMDAIVDYDDPNFADAVLRGKWAYIHQVENKALFSYKVDIELNEPFRWDEALVSFAKEIGVSVAYSDENSPTDGNQIVVSALGGERKLTVTPDLYDAE